MQIDRRTRWRRALAVVVLAMALPGVLLAGVGAVRAVATVDADENDALAAAQVRFLRHAVATGAPQRMAKLFPEGAEFTAVLTALADLDLAARGQTEQVDAVRSAQVALDLTDAPDTLGRFGVDDPPGGVFLVGWALAVSVRRAELTGEAADVADAVRRAAVLAVALDRGLGRGQAFLASYPGQMWPVDTVGAVAGLQRVQRLVPDPDRAALLNRWRATALTHLDARTGLLPHRTDSGSAVLEGPRATSSSVMLAFWSDAFGTDDPVPWTGFVAAFVVRRAGLVGVREYPAGHDGPALGDVDSGPLVAGVSLSATVVALAGARRYGDLELADSWQREAEVFGFPFSLRGRRYAAGVLPVGDAFLAWARAEPVAAEGEGLAESVKASAAADRPGRAVAWPWPAAVLALCLAGAAGAVRSLVRPRTRPRISDNR